MIENIEIKQHIKDEGLTQWKIADAMGKSETTVNRWLRYPLNDEQKKMFADAIEKCKRERRENR